MHLGAYRGESQAVTGIRQVSIVVTFVLAAASTACAAGGDASTAVVGGDVGPGGEAAVSASTTQPPVAVAGSVDAPDETLARLDVAVESGDLCEVHEALGTLSVSPGDLRSLLHTLDLVASTLYAADDLVPAELAGAWEEMEYRLDMARSELSKPGAGVAEVVDIFSGLDYARAQTAIDEWLEARCA